MSPTRAVLAAVVVLALALAAVPSWLPRLPPGPIRGLVVDRAGYAVADAQVYLFLEQEERLCGSTRTDAAGEFSFPFAPPTPRVFVRAPAGSGLLDAFGPPADDVGARLEFVLAPARPLTVRVHDEHGNARAGVEVRVYEERLEAAALALGRTDAEGCARLPAPARAHVGVLAADHGPARWRFELEVPEAGRELVLELPVASIALRGRVRSSAEEAGLAGCWVLVHEPEGGDGWSAAARTDAEGRFELRRTPRAAELQVLDPSGRYLPLAQALAAEGPQELELRLAGATHQIVHTASGGRPLRARVFALDPHDGGIGWGLRTNGAGRVELPVGARFTVLATPLDPARPPIERWDLAPSSRELRLEAEPDP